MNIDTDLPFLAILKEPTRVFAHQTASPIVQTLGLAEPTQLLLPIAVPFGLAGPAAGAVRLKILCASTRVTYPVGTKLRISNWRMSKLKHWRSNPLQQALPQAGVIFHGCL